MRYEPGEIVGLVLHFRTPINTLACINSQLSEGVREFVLVDNSEDGGESLLAMRDGLDRLMQRGADVQVLRPAANLGFAKGVNMGLACAARDGASTILLMNSDAQLDPGALASLVKCLDGADVVVPLVRARRDAVAISLLGNYQCALGLVLRKRWPGCLSYPSGCCLLLRASRVGLPLFDEDFFFYGEDVLLGLTSRFGVLKIVECRGAAVIHAGSGSAKNGSFFYEYHINRGHWLLASKLAANWFFRAAYIGCRCLSLPLRATVRSMRFQSLTPWRALIAATLDVAQGRRRTFMPPG